MIKMTITTDNPLLQELASLASRIGGDAGLPATAMAFNLGANKISDTWKAYASKKTSITGVPDMKRASQSYMKGVGVKKDNSFSYTISNSSYVAPFLEYGTKEYDMKHTHPYGKKSRVGCSWNSKTKHIEKVPYLIIPFSWGTVGTVTTFSNTMTESIAQIAQRLKKSQVKQEMKIEENSAGEGIPRHTYEWGERLKGEDGSHAGGMVRMKDSASKGSSYFTFRVVSAKSPANSWISRGIPARHVTRGIVTQCMPDIEKDIQTGIEADIT